MPLPARIGPELSSADLQALREAMTLHAGVERTRAGLERLLSLIARIETRAPGAPVLSAASLIAQGALAREESRGGHYRADFPAIAEAVRTFVTQNPTDATLRYAAE